MQFVCSEPRPGRCCLHLKNRILCPVLRRLRNTPIKFNYLPRYYDPEKEERDRRRAELRGERAEDAGKEYKPGQYIRTQSQARAARRREEMSRGSGRMWMMVVLVVLVLLFLVFGYPRVVAFISDMQKPKTPQTEEFNPYTPITVVPNDYEE